MRKKASFSKPFDEAMIHMQLLEEMAHAHNFIGGYEECLRETPTHAKTIQLHAEAALRVIRRIEEIENNIKPSDLN